MVTGSRLWTGLRRLWASVAFRLALNYGVLALLTLVSVLSVFYLQTVGVMEQRVLRQIAISHQQLVSQFEQGGHEALQREIQRLTADGVDSDSEIYLLLDAQGRQIAGNHTLDPALVTRMLQRDSQVHAYPFGRASAHRLSDGSVLVIGNDLQDLRQFESLVGNATQAAALLAVLLVVGGTALFRDLLERQVASIRRTVATVSEGELAERIRPRTQDDEFARLEQDINHMLDRIVGLMDGVRHVSNTIAHNLRTPLTRILTRLRAVQKPGTPPEALREATQTAIAEIEELTTVFEKLLQIAEAEAGARRQHFEPVGLHALLTDVVELYEAVAEDSGSHIDYRPIQELTVIGDRDLLASAFANLVDNALKHAGPGARVELRTFEQRGRAVVTISDNGPGIPAGSHGLLGTRFHRLSDDTPGHGLGLASVKAIVQLHGADLHFENANPGLRVRVALPLLPA